ncbi:MAG TPA: exopolysaccharide biosynthesis protein, partial [Algoriphagus sp.]|nr:exopolysaccharide biosynthesis protein [Algoriphagus sp.]
MAENKHFSDNQFTLKEVIQNLRDWFRYFLSQWKTLLLAGLIGMV